MLDLTETIVQSLVLDIPNITFTVCESRKSAMERQFIVEAMPLAQSTAMDEEYGITAKPEVLYCTCHTITYRHYEFCRSSMKIDPNMGFLLTDCALLCNVMYCRRPRQTEYQDPPTTAFLTCRTLT